MLIILAIAPSPAPLKTMLNEQATAQVVLVDEMNFFNRVVRRAELLKNIRQIESNADVANNFAFVRVDVANAKRCRQQCRNPP